MTQTKYEKEHAADSQRRHLAARDLLYPRVFPAANLTFECCDEAAPGCLGHQLDTRYGIDKILRVDGGLWRKPICYSLQERFRSMDDYHYRQVTITEWNHASNQPSEFYKIIAELFVYGYFDDEFGFFREVIVLNLPEMKRRMLQGMLTYEMGGNPKGQSFIGLSIDRLLQEDKERPGLIFFYERDGDISAQDEDEEDLLRDWPQKQDPVQRVNMAPSVKENRLAINEDPPFADEDEEEEYPSASLVMASPLFRGGTSL